MLEEGSDLASELWTAPYPAASSVLSYPEGRAALAAAHRGRRLTAAGYGRAVEAFEAAHADLVIVGVDRELAQRAGDLAADLGLRGYDAVHLASALALQAEDTTVVTWDSDLRRAAAESGCALASAS